ncbi:ABC transporter permease [Dactylosporangium sp. NPDC049525]|uniref:ABC transporter permease n=1 Tax=Dactylosporangium sp. NPDC049525 TaxID=3154730 RepID=UPI0034490EDD
MTAALITETVKLRRSRMWWITLLGFTVAGAVGTLFMYIGQDPGRARKLGLLGDKAQLATITADWPGHLALLGQISSIGGVGIFGVLIIWIFGREFSDHTVKDLLALPTSRTAIVLAKFTVAAGWSAVLTLYLCGLGIAGGAILDLPGWSAGAATHGLGRLVAAAGMTLLLTFPFALAASAGRGYLAAVGALFGAVFSAQIVAALGYGAYFPWSVPALYTGVTGPDGQHAGWWSPITVAAVGVVAVGATVRWWRRADQTG